MSWIWEEHFFKSVIHGQSLSDMRQKWRQSWDKILQDNLTYAHKWGAVALHGIYKNVQTYHDLDRTSNIQRYWLNFVGLSRSTTRPYWPSTCGPGQRRCPCSTTASTVGCSPAPSASPPPGGTPATTLWGQSSTWTGPWIGCALENVEEVGINMIGSTADLNENEIYVSKKNQWI